MNTLFIAILSMTLAVAAQFTLKIGMSSPEVQELIEHPLTVRSILSFLTNKFVFGGLFLYGLGAAAWLPVLYKWDVSKAYPLVGLGFAISVVIGFFTGEEVSLIRAFGVALICCGVIVVSQS